MILWIWRTLLFFHFSLTLSTWQPWTGTRFQFALNYEFHDLTFETEGKKAVEQEQWISRRKEQIHSITSLCRLRLGMLRQMSDPVLKILHSLPNEAKFISFKFKSTPRNVDSLHCVRIHCNVQNLFYTPPTLFSRSADMRYLILFTNWVRALYNLTERWAASISHHISIAVAPNDFGRSNAKKCQGDRDTFFPHLQFKR